MITALSLSPAVDKIYFVDNFEAGRLYRVKKVYRSAGGKGINVARVAATIGENVALAGFKAGNTGNWLETQVKDLGVDTRFVEVEGESRTNNNIIDREKGTETEVLEMGPYIKSEDAERFLNTLEQLLSATKVLVCSGGLPEGIPADFYKTIITAAGKYNLKIILDSSNEMLSEGIKGKPYLIKPNLRELSRFVGKQLTNPGEIVDSCRYIISMGVEVVVASMGGEGSMLVTKDSVLVGRPPKVDIMKTIGSGDSMVAGLAAGLARGYSMEEMLRLGMACATANTQFVEIGYVSTELVEKYLGEVVIEDFT